MTSRDILQVSDGKVKSYVKSRVGPLMPTENQNTDDSNFIRGYLH